MDTFQPEKSFSLVKRTKFLLPWKNTKPATETPTPKQNIKTVDENWRTIVLMSVKISAKKWYFSENGVLCQKTLNFPKTVGRLHFKSRKQVRKTVSAKVKSEQREYLCYHFFQKR